ncbi:MAG: hypothetical protein R2800_15430 [Flavipsychrobacter sp.]
MKYLLIAFLLMVGVTNVRGQEDEGYGIVPKVLPTDTTEVVIKQMIKDIIAEQKDYQLIFVDSQRRGRISYVYKSASYETLKIMYKHREIAQDDTTPVRRIVTYAHIKGDRPVMTSIYNYIFKTSIRQDEAIAYSANGTTITYKGKDQQFVFMPDENQPGYWEIIFIK